MKIEVKGNFLELPEKICPSSILTNLYIVRLSEKFMGLKYWLLWGPKNHQGKEIL